MLSFGDAKSWGQYHSYESLTVEIAFTASLVITALLELGDDRKP